MSEGENIKGASPARASRGVRILVVDDDALVRWSLERSLAGAGHQVMTATDGLDAVTRLDEGSFDIVITDMQMPRMGGGELLSEVKKRSPATQVIILSGLFSREVARDAVEAGAAMYLQKPMDLGAINRVVDSMVRGIIV